jgi:hypothetical protein
MAGNLLSATTGMRQGEVLAVRGGDTGEDVLRVAHSWSPADGLKSPKNGEARGKRSAGTGLDHVDVSA